jgi:hypothetical protein
MSELGFHPPRARRGAIAAIAIAMLVIAGCSAEGAASSDEPWPQDGPLTVEPSQRLEENVTYSLLSGPPVVPNDEPGACTSEVNPNHTGCIQTERSALGSMGTYWADSDYLFMGAIFAGAPESGPGSEYTGEQLLLVKTDGSTFENGDSWKCLTCGLPAPVEAGAAYAGTSSFTYPINGFRDGDRVLAGTSILDCGEYRFADVECTPDQVHVYPLHWDMGGEESGAVREPRLHPDDNHIGFSHFDPKQFGQFAFMGRLEFNDAQQRYDILDSKYLFNPAPEYQTFAVDGNSLQLNDAGMVGEFRGWTADGTESIGIAQVESGNVDAVATDLVTGDSRPLTHHAGYMDPLMASPAGNYLLAENTLGSGRLDFLAGAPGVPPIIDQLPLAGYIAGIRNNQERRFFLPYLVDTETRKSQLLSYDGDPNWNASADPAWLPDGTGAAWAEQIVQAPACGGENPLPCPEISSGQPPSRVVLARFDDFEPSESVDVEPATVVEWGIDYEPGQPLPHRPSLPAGTYTVEGAEGGAAEVVVTANDTDTRTMSIAVEFNEYTDDDETIINGPQSVEIAEDSPLSDITWHADLVISGRYEGAVQTSPDGFTVDRQTKMTNVFQSSGTMTTTINGHTYTQPVNGG